MSIVNTRPVWTPVMTAALAAETCGLTYDDGPGSVQAAITSGLTAGIANPDPRSHHHGQNLDLPHHRPRMTPRIARRRHLTVHGALASDGSGGRGRRVMLVETARAARIDRVLSHEHKPCAKLTAVHDPAKPKLPARRRGLRREEALQWAHPGCRHGRGPIAGDRLECDADHLPQRQTVRLFTFKCGCGFMDGPPIPDSNPVSSLAVLSGRDRGSIWASRSSPARGLLALEHHPAKQHSPSAPAGMDLWVPRVPARQKCVRRIPTLAQQFLALVFLQPKIGYANT